VTHLVQVFREVKRVLRSDGTLWLNLGDSFATHQSGGKSIGLEEKNLCGIPWRAALALQADGWYLRMDIIWSKPNCMPEPVQDRPVKSHEYIFLLTKSKKYFYGADAVREPYTEPLNRWGGEKTKATDVNKGDGSEFSVKTRTNREQRPDASGRNLRSVWEISPRGFPGAHFAVFPEEIPIRCIKAGCPEGGSVLDPFAGSGTTLEVAKRMNLDYVGIELNEDYIENIIKPRLENVNPLFA
jgi:DNA modification methylase